MRTRLGIVPLYSVLALLLACGSDGDAPDSTAADCAALAATGSPPSSDEPVGLATSLSLWADASLATEPADVTVFVRPEEAGLVGVVAEVVAAVEGVTVLETKDQQASYDDFREMFAQDPALADALTVEDMPATVVAVAADEAALTALRDVATADPRVLDVGDDRLADLGVRPIAAGLVGGWGSAVEVLTHSTDPDLARFAGTLAGIADGTGDVAAEDLRVVRDGSRHAREVAARCGIDVTG